MDEGLLVCFKNCWGLKNAPCKQGVTQDMNRLSYLGAISHIRRVNTPLSKSAKSKSTTLSTLIIIWCNVS